MPPSRAAALRRTVLRALPPCLAVVTALACDRDGPPAGEGGEVAAEVAPPAPTLSRIDVPIRYDFTPILREVERVVPRTFGSLDSLHQVGDDERKHYAYEATRGAFTTFMDGSQVHLRAVLSYGVRGQYNPPVGPTLRAGCGTGDERPRIAVEIVTPLTLTPTWRLRSAARLGRLAPVSEGREDRCRISILRYDVTDRLIDAAGQALSAQMPAIDEKVAGVDLTDQVTGWWEQLNRPIRLADGVWLLLQPQQLRAGRVTGEGRVLTVQAGLDAYPKVVTGPEPPPTVRPLPPLGPDTLGDGFHILLDGNVDYATASRAVTDALRGRSVTQAGRSVSVRSVTVTPRPGGRLALSVGFVGDAAGTLSFVGTPRYDAASGHVMVPDLDYDLETDSELVNTVAWIRSDALRTLFREKARLPVAPVLERGRELLTSGLNRTIGEAVTLSATVDSVTVQGLHVTRAGLVVRAGASGNAQVSVRQR